MPDWVELKDSSLAHLVELAKQEEPNKEPAPPKSKAVVYTFKDQAYGARPPRNLQVPSPMATNVLALLALLLSVSAIYFFGALGLFAFSFIYLMARSAKDHHDNAYEFAVRYGGQSEGYWSGLIGFTYVINLIGLGCSVAFLVTLGVGLILGLGLLFV